MGRNSDNTLYYDELGWVTDAKLYDGMVETYFWIENEIQKESSSV